MFMQRSECSNCGHSMVCGCKGRYRDFSNDIQKAAERGGLMEDKDNFFALVDCRQWTPMTQRLQAKMDMLRGPDVKEE